MDDLLGVDLFPSISQNPVLLRIETKVDHIALDVKNGFAEQRQRGENSDTKIEKMAEDIKNMHIMMQSKFFFSLSFTLK